MIPLIVPPLAGLTVLVTRPAAQAAQLAASIGAQHGHAIVFPTIAIEALDAQPQQDHALIVFTSVYAVEHGARLIRNTETTKIAAIGKATAAALATLDLHADVVPDADFTSEALLAHPELNTLSDRRVLIVKGEGGRETLHEALVARGATVTKCVVYRRVKPQVDVPTIDAIELEWASEGIDVVTATSVETYLNLAALLTDRGRSLLREATLLAPTQRILDAARSDGWCGEGLVSRGADDAAILGTLARWNARARTR